MIDPISAHGMEMRGYKLRDGISTCGTVWGLEVWQRGTEEIIIYSGKQIRAGEDQLISMMDTKAINIIMRFDDYLAITARVQALMDWAKNKKPR